MLCEQRMCQPHDPVDTARACARASSACQNTQSFKPYPGQLYTCAAADSLDDETKCALHGGKLACGVLHSAAKGFNVWGKKEGSRLGESKPRQKNGTGGAAVVQAKSRSWVIQVLGDGWGLRRVHALGSSKRFTEWMQVKAGCQAPRRRAHCRRRLGARRLTAMAPL